MLHIFRSKKDILRLSLDIIIFATSYVCAFLLRFDAEIPSPYLALMFQTLPIILLVQFLTFWYFGLFHGIWRYTSVSDLRSLLKAVLVGAAIMIIVIFMSHLFKGFPRSIFIIYALVLILLAGGIRFIRRIMADRAYRAIMSGKRTLVVGAGDTGESIVREMMMNKSSPYIPICIVDDDLNKKKKKIHGVDVAGGCDDIPHIVMKEGIEEIIIAIPRASGETMRRIVNLCRKTETPFKTVPALGMISHGISLDLLRECRVEDLVSRQTVKWSTDEIEKYFKGKSVLITGAGGSIGSELCMQLIHMNPEKLILLERAENSLFSIHSRLKEESHNTKIIHLVMDVCNEDSVDKVLKSHHPEMLFHVAAHKHVSLMEENPFESIRNNLLTTRNLVDLCSNNGLQTLVFISTDKAANPVSFMGVSKRIAEQYIQEVAREQHSRFICVRFGNVLESSGSVIPIFKERIRKRKPLTVTHPDASRYFMSKSEAAYLILQATIMGKGGELFVLDMGKRVKILDVANELLALANLEAGEDIPIKFIGLKSGEKLVEDLNEQGEELVPSLHPKIMKVNNNNSINLEDLNHDLDDIEELVRTMDIDGLKKKLKQIVPTYNPDYRCEGI
ncbi:MAG: hypothetical protein SCARUB_02077 [Candidatus Scalindua rubra]|uniref:Polysaccharide biosynthesis protein CapD-like domain-containing protein n=1 Tax=Candidatus Scalindua rubra TaxID=1872076 RepID=A0A1E3XAS6_9BACT|nr:MAG: hypothetical protein SCARUB_02077 [Candidatus Scalindua rubra]